MHKNEHLQHEEIYPGLYINSKPPDGTDMVVSLKESRISLEEMSTIMGKIEVAKQKIKLKPYLN